MKEREKFIKKVTQEYSKALEKTAIPSAQSILREVNQFQGGGICELSHMFQTSNGIQIHFNTVIIHFSGQGIGSSIKHEPMKCYCGIIVKGAVPSSYYLKEVRDGLSRRLNWLPYIPQVNVQDTFKNRDNWDAFISSIVNDSKCVEDLRKLPRSRTIKGVDRNFKTSRLSKLEVKIEDRDDNSTTLGQIVPMGHRTFIGVNYVVRDFKDIQYAVNAMLNIIGHIQNLKYGQNVEKPIVDTWAEKLLKQINQREPPTDSPSIEQTPQPIIQESSSGGLAEPQKNCSNCGHKNPIEFRFCKNCGTEFKQSENQCPNCGHINEPKFRFCVSCGTEIGTQQPEPDLEIVTEPQPAPLPEPETLIIPELPEPHKPQLLIEKSDSYETQTESHDIAEDLTELFEEEVAVIEDPEPSYEPAIDEVDEEDEEVSVTKVSFETKTGKERELELKDILDKGWISEGRVLDLIWEQVDASEQYDWFKALKHVEHNHIVDHNIWMHLTIKFTSEAEEPFTDTLYHILLAVNPEENEFTGAGTNIAASEDTYFDCLNIVINKPEQIKQLTLWVPLDYTKK